MATKKEKKAPHLDLWSGIRIARHIHEAQCAANAIIEPTLPQIARVIDAIVARILTGGSWYYVGAGTSARLAAVDASELPPTFGVPHDLVQTFPAGGQISFWQSVEGAEDDEGAGTAAIRENATDKDVVFGVAASGNTPYTVAALTEAKRMGALTVALVNSEGSRMERLVDLPIVAPVRREPVRGSTRMVSGDVTKRVLNIVSTGVMARLGRTYDDLMIFMPPSNAKLTDRARAMVMEAGGTNDLEASRLLGLCGNDVAVASIVARRGIDIDEARGLLEGRYRVFRAAISGPRRAG